MKSLKDAILIAILAIILGFVVNFTRNQTSSGGIPINTPWPDNREIVELEFPSSYDSTMDSLISLEDAYNIYLSGTAVFIDAREQEEYDEGHIKGALNLPFEWWDDYWMDVEPYLTPVDEIVVYCGGLDCELSLFAARELDYLGYKKSYIFFGGWQKWIDDELPTEITEFEDD